MRWSSFGWFLLGFVLAPFAITGWYRLGLKFEPFVLDMALPFVILTAGAMALFFGTRYRSAALGVVVGSITWALFLIALFWQLGSGPQIP